MARGKWWEPGFFQRVRDIEEIKAEFEENGFSNLTQIEIKHFQRYSIKMQKKEMGQRVIAERKVIIFIVSGMFLLLGFNVLGMGQTNPGFFLIFLGGTLLLFALFKNSSWKGR